MQKWIIAGTMAVALAGCTGQFENIGNIGRPSDPSRFYVLAPSAKEAMAPVTNTVIGVGPVTVADYLDRSQMVVRDSENHIELQEFDRWAGSIPKEVQKVVVANLVTLSGAQKVLHYPWKAGLDTDYTVEIYVEQMDYDQGNAKLIMQWQLYEGNGRDLVLARRSVWSVATEKDFNAVAKALSGHLEMFSEEVAREIAARSSTAGFSHQIKNRR